LAGLG